MLLIGSLLPRRPGDPATLVASSKKLRDELNWQPRHSLETIIQTAYDWHHRYPKRLCRQEHLK